MGPQISIKFILGPQILMLGAWAPRAPLDLPLRPITMLLIPIVMHYILMEMHQDAIQKDSISWWY